MRTMWLWFWPFPFLYPEQNQFYSVLYIESLNNFIGKKMFKSHLYTPLPVLSLHLLLDSGHQVVEKHGGRTQQMGPGAHSPSFPFSS